MIILIEKVGIMSIWNNVNFMAVWGHPAVPRHKDSTDKKIFEKAKKTFLQYFKG